MAHRNKAMNLLTLHVRRLYEGIRAVYQTGGFYELVRRACKRTIETVIHPLLGPVAGLILRKKASKINNDIGSLVTLAFNFNFVGITIRPSQIPEEIKKLLEVIRELRPKNILEIGTELGGTLFLFSWVARDDAKIISIDLPGGPFGGGYPLWRVALYKLFVKKGQKLYLIRADSHDPKTLNKVKQILRGQKLDFLFIDGDHTYEGVKRDFEMYSPLVRKGGIIVLHDIVPGPSSRVGGVPRFWQEIKHRYKYLEIVRDWNQGGHGIGVLFKDH